MRFVLCHQYSLYYFFFFNDTATTEIYTLSLHDALPIYHGRVREESFVARHLACLTFDFDVLRSEEHTSELQSPYDLVCRLLLEKKKKKHQDRQCQKMKQNQLISRAKGQRKMREDGFGAD